MRRVFIIIILSFFLCGIVIPKHRPEISPYINFLNKGCLSGVDYVMSLFERYDVVILCERDHAELTQYDFIRDLIADKRFIDKVGNVFMEIGGAHLKSRFDNLVLANNPSDSIQLAQKILTLYRDLSFYPLWNNYSYYYYLYSVCHINRHLGLDEKIRLFPLDIAFDWNEIKNKSQYKNRLKGSRDPLMARNALTYYKESLNNSEKVLIILNEMHAFSNYEKIDPSFKNFMYYFEREIGKPFANVYIHNFSSDEACENYVPINGGRWDASFRYLKIENAGFNFADSPFGDDKFDAITDLPNDLRYRDVFTGLIYLPLDKCHYRWGIPDVISDDFEKEIIRRHRIVGNPTNIDTIKNWYNNIEEESYLDYCPDFYKIVNYWLK